MDIDPETDSVENVTDDKVISEEYKIWKKNTPFLYDLILTHALEWPSLTVQWLPKAEITENKDYIDHEILLGTHTSGNDQNYLMIANVRLPLPETEIDIHNYDEENGEAGGYSGISGKIDISIKINHQGEVNKYYNFYYILYYIYYILYINKARFMPQDPFLIATKTPSGEVHIFDRTKHPSVPRDNEVNPQIRCAGHTAEGYGLAWSSLEKGLLLSGSDDHVVCYWDTNNTARNTAGMLDPVRKFNYHTDVVEDVCWHPIHKDIFASVGDDKYLYIADIREDTFVKQVQAHTKEVNTVAFNPFDEHLCLTGSSDTTLRLWDTRNFSHPLHVLEGHSDAIYTTQWNPKYPYICMSAGEDRRCIVWDLSRIGREQTPEEAVDGPPELLFIHGGHTSKISEVSWNPSDAMCVASVAEDNVLQVWNMAENIYNEDIDDELDLNDANIE
ncbi:hypothetical protein WA158_004760 [Blastocystis sp. Blastoise]